MAVLVGASMLAVSFAGLAPAANGAPASRTQATDPGYTATKVVGRSFANADGSTYDFPAYTMTVTADHTRNLHGRERVLISWSGAQPSGGRAGNPFGEYGLNQEYPVVVLQCRGVDDPTAPPSQRLSPQTCWTNSVAQRSQIARSDSEAVFVADLFASPEAKQRVYGPSPFPTNEQCPGVDTPGYFTHLTPFIAANGTVYPACSTTTMPPEAAVDAALPAAEVAAFTDLQGNGSVNFEVRSNAENESLGCSPTVACSIVVVPINGISCQPSMFEPPAPVDNGCRLGGRFEPGSSNFAKEGVDLAVGPALWWSESNWHNRFSIPITFGLPPDACDVLDQRAPTGFYGSELLAQAALQWSPAYCLDKKRFKFQHNQMSDAAGWNLMEGGGGAAALVSSEHKRRGEDPVGYAPTAVTGFAIGYIIDRPDNAGEYTSLKLSPRLIAKLLTQSYPASANGVGHPGMSTNPLALMNDPEFNALNPGLSSTTQEAGATLLSLSNESDVIEQLTDYISQDRAAMDFVAGKPDPWGMVINPKYKNIKLPRAEWPLLDDYIPVTADTCRQANPNVYLTQVAAPVTSLSKIALALLDGWPNVQTRCDTDTATGAFKLGRIDRQGYGTRFMLGLVSLGDAARYGLRTAALQTGPDEFVAPTSASLAAAVRLAKQAAPNRAFVIDQKQVRKAGNAYPGTMIVYTAAKLAGLSKEDAEKVSMFIRTSTTEGQKSGSGNGELPLGFLPIEKSGATAKLFKSAKELADQIASQDAAPEKSKDAKDAEDGKDGKGGKDGLPSPPGLGDGTPEPQPASDPMPVDVPAAPTEPDPGVVAAVDAVTNAQVAPAAAPTLEMPATTKVGSPIGRGLVPGLLAFGLLALGASALIRLLTARSR